MPPRVLDNIERLRGPTRERVDEQIARGRPFIFVDFLSGSFLERCRDRDALVATLGSGVVGFDASGKQINATVADYFTRGEAGAGSVNVTFPPALERQLIELARGSYIGHPSLGLTTWMGRSGCLQRFHCDMDSCHNFLVQVYGEKRVCLVPPAETQKMQPSLERQLLFSELTFHRWSEQEKLAFLRFADGRDSLLHPGEALYIPPLWWHYVEYLSDSLSPSWRFQTLPLTEDPATVWPRLWTREWPLWQGIVSTLASSPELARSHAARAGELMARLRDPSARDARQALRALHDELCPGRYAVELAPADRPFFEVRPERPLPRKQGPWRPDEVPRLAPYLRFAAIAGNGEARTLAVLDDQRVVAEIPIEADDFEAIFALTSALQEPGAHADVARLAGTIGLAVDDVCALLEQFSAEGWISA